MILGQNNFQTNNSLHEKWHSEYSSRRVFNCNTEIIQDLYIVNSCHVPIRANLI